LEGREWEITGEEAGTRIQRAEGKISKLSGLLSGVGHWGDHMG
jgi:hypothetical protein